MGKYFQIIAIVLVGVLVGAGASFLYDFDKEYKEKPAQTLVSKLDTLKRNTLKFIEQKTIKPHAAPGAPQLTPPPQTGTTPDQENELRGEKSLTQLINEKAAKSLSRLPSGVPLGTRMAGIVTHKTDKVYARFGSTPRLLQRGSLIFVGDEVITGAARPRAASLKKPPKAGMKTFGPGDILSSGNSRVVIKMIDDAEIFLGDFAHFHFKRYSYDTATKKGEADLFFHRGSYRIKSGLIAKLNKLGKKVFKLRTSETMTVPIGTDFSGTIEEFEDIFQYNVVLVSGSILVGAPSGWQMVDAPFMGVTFITNAPSSAVTAWNSTYSNQPIAIIEPVTVTGTGSNTPPVAVEDDYGAPYNTPVNFSLLDNDYDPDTGTNVGLVVDNGYLTLTSGVTIGADGTGTYTPDATANVNGSFTFPYAVSDGTDTSGISYVRIAISKQNNSLPDAVDDSTITTTEGVSVEFDPLVNDTDADGDTITLYRVSQPSKGGGTAITSNGKKITYFPPVPTPGGPPLTDTFSYSVRDGNDGGDSALVTVTVSNSPPVAVSDSFNRKQVTASCPTTAFNVLTNDTDPGGATLTLDSYTTPLKGSLNPSGATTSGNFTWDPGTFLGSTTFTYDVSDGYGMTATGTVTLSTKTANAAPEAVADAFSTTQGADVFFTASDLTTNDSDPDCDTLTVTVIQTKNSGQLPIDGPDSGGTYKYTPIALPTGSSSTSEEYSYTVEDGNGGRDNAVITFTVSNAAPVANDDSVNVEMNVAKSFTTMDNDLDPGAANDPISYVSSTALSASSGTLSDLGGGSFNYAPNTSFTGTDSFTYTIKDSHGLTDSASVTLTVTDSTPPEDSVNIKCATHAERVASFEELYEMVVHEVSGNLGTIPGYKVIQNPWFEKQVTVFGNPDPSLWSLACTTTIPQVPPVANDDEVVTQMNTPVDFSVIANDSDANYDPLAVISVETIPTAKGTLTNNGDGTFTYSPQGYFGTFSFQYTLTDGVGGTDTAKVTITVLTSVEDNSCDDGTLLTTPTGGVNLNEAAKTIKARMDTELADSNITQITNNELLTLILGKANQQTTHSYSAGGNTIDNFVPKAKLQISPLTGVTLTMQIAMIDTMYNLLPASLQAKLDPVFITLLGYSTYKTCVTINATVTLSQAGNMFHLDGTVKVGSLPTFTIQELVDKYNAAVVAGDLTIADAACADGTKGRFWVGGDICNEAQQIPTNKAINHYFDINDYVMGNNILYLNK